MWTYPRASDMHSTCSITKPQSGSEIFLLRAEFHNISTAKKVQIDFERILLAFTNNLLQSGLHRSLSN